MIIDAVATKDSWNPTSNIQRGLMNKRSKAASDKVLIESYLLYTNEDRDNKLNIIEDLSTDAGKPIKYP